MKIRRIVTAVTTVVVAIVVALAVPVSQLRTVSTITAKCCCPDPAHCHCPDHSRDPAQQPQLKTCHRTSYGVLAPQPPVSAPPAVAAVAPGVRAVVLVALAPAAPHPAPAARRPDAPS